MENTKRVELNSAIEAFLANGGKVTKIAKVLGEKKTYKPARIKGCIGTSWRNRSEDSKLDRLSRRLSA